MTLDGVTSVHLSLSESATAARHLYEKRGFETWGVEPDAIRFEGMSDSERHMWLRRACASDRPRLLGAANKTMFERQSHRSVAGLVPRSRRLWLILIVGGS